VASLMFRILSRIRLLVIQVFDQFVVCSCEECAHRRTKPVYPVVARERPRRDGRTKGAGRVKGAARKIDPWERQSANTHQKQTL
jgi:hypothetical protein